MKRVVVKGIELIAVDSPNLQMCTECHFGPNDGVRSLCTGRNGRGGVPEECLGYKALVTKEKYIQLKLKGLV